MRETNIFHLITEHPLITFLVSAVLLIGLLLIVANLLMNYREKQGNKDEARNNFDR